MIIDLDKLVSIKIMKVNNQFQLTLDHSKMFKKEMNSLQNSEEDKLYNTLLLQKLLDIVQKTELTFVDYPHKLPFILNSIRMIY